MSTPSIDKKVLAAARVEVAALLRISAVHGYNEGIDNHYSLAIDGHDDVFLLNRYGPHWSEMKPSDILLVDLEGNVLDGSGGGQVTAIQIHRQVHAARPNARCVMHTHMPYATALTLTQDRALDTTLSQNAMRFHGRVAADPHYNGLALDAGEGERIAMAMHGADVAFLGNHGVVVCGRQIAHAYDDLYFLERACMMQVLAQSTGRPLAPCDPVLAARVGGQAESERQQSELFFEALRRTL